MMSETQMDWQQVVLNGGPPCFARLEDEEGYYCGRAERWEGHDGEHKFVSLDDLLDAERERWAKIARDKWMEMSALDSVESEHYARAGREIAAAIAGEKCPHGIYRHLINCALCDASEKAHAIRGSKQ